MNIGIISTIGNAHSWAGSEEMWKGVANAALENNHQVLIHAAEKIARSEHVNKLQAKGALSYARQDLSALTRRLANRHWYSRYQAFFAQEIDVLCLSMGGIADCIWMPDLLESIYHTNVPYLVIVQANAEGIVTAEEHREKLRRFYARAIGVIFVSHHNHVLAKRQLGMSFPNPQIICNPLRDTVHELIEWPTRNEIFKLAEVARLEVIDKQQDHLLEALSSPEWKIRNWTLTFFGSGADEGHIHRLIQFYGLQGKVTVGGYVRDFKQIWQEHHLHVLPSRREGMPLALIESMACGRPAVVTRAGGSPELVDDQVNGFVCPGMHPEVLRETLEQAWAKRDQWQEMGKAAASKVKQVVSPDWADQILSILVNAAKQS